MNISKKYGPGLIFIVVAAIFSISSAVNYRFGSFTSPGPGLFPIVISAVLLVLGVISIGANYAKEIDPAYIDVKALLIIVASIASFGVATMLLNMAAGIASLVIVASYAVKEPVPKYQNLKIIPVLLIAALGFKYLVGVNIPLWK